VQGALQQWLGDLIAVQDVSVEGEDSTFTVIVTYRTAATTEAQTAQFTRPL
jgi:GMP synthase PP-ATPase subunit